MRRDAHPAATGAPGSLASSSLPLGLSRRSPLMMAVTYSFLTLLLCLLTGGGNDLLDYLPTESYWREKKVEVTVDQMIAQLAEKPGQDVSALVKDLGSPDAAKRDDASMKLRSVGAPAMKSLQDAGQ